MRQLLLTIIIVFAMMAVAHSASGAPTRADGSSDIVEATVKVNLNEDRADNADMVLAVSSDTSGEIAVFKSRIDYFSGEAILLVPEGSYDLCIYGKSNEDIENVLLTYRDVEIKEGSLFECSFDDATICIENQPRASDGTILTGDSEGNAGNIISGSSLVCICYADKYLDYFGFDTSGRYPIGKYFKTNTVDSPFSFTIASSYAYTGGTIGLVIPIDFSKPSISPSNENWQTLDIDFCKTPLNLRKEDVFKHNKEERNAYAYEMELWHGNEDILGKGANGMTDLPFNENIKEIWTDAATADYDLWIYPLGSTFTQGFASFPCIEGMPLRRGEKSLEQIGINIGHTIYNRDDNGSNYSGNPLFNGTPDYTILGNSTPSLITLPRLNGFTINYMGRHAEALTIDVSTFPKEEYPHWTEEEYEALKLPVCNVNVYVNGEEVCSSTEDLNKATRLEGVFDATVSTDNILIDGEIEGSSFAQIHYDSTTGNHTAPTLISLQIRDGKNTISDRLTTGDEGTIEFYAMAPIEASSESDKRKSTYYTTGNIAVAKAEWAPSNTDDWEPIDMNEVPELFYIPGWGHFFRGSLANINKPSANKWYDLRIYVEDEFGAWQSQTIRPAFRVEEPLGLDKVDADEGIIKVEGNSIIAPDSAHIFTMQGVEISHTDLAPGIYIVTYGNKCQKVIIK